MLTASGVSYVLPGGRELFREVELTVTPGTATAVEGPSGTGKTTLLALLGHLLTPTSGSVTVATERRLPFAWVLQSLNTLGARSVTANVCLANVIDGEPRALTQAKALRALDSLQMGHLARERARVLSGGEQQRLTVARALVSTRPIILADEPTNQLDRANARLVMEALVNAAAEGKAVVIVTHDREALPDHCRTLRLSERGLVES